MSAPPMPLYDQTTVLRAWWIGDCVFDVELRWIAFIYDGHAFSAGHDTAWLGPARGGLMMDSSGRIVLWTPDVAIVGDVSPYRPARPARPPRPERPLRPNLPPNPYKPARPSDGWSKLSLREWFGVGAVKVVQDDSVAGISPNEITFDD